MPLPRRRTRLSSRVARKTEVFSGPDKRSSPGSTKTAEGRPRAIGIERGQPVGWCRHLSRRQIGKAQRTYKGLAANPRRKPRDLHRADCAFLSFVGGTVRKNARQGNTPRLQRASIMTSKPGGPEGHARVWGLAVPREAFSAQSPDNWFSIRAGYVAVEQPINRSLSHSGGGLRQKPQDPGVPRLQQNLRLKATICEDCLGHERHCRSVPRETGRKARPEKHRA